VDNNGINNEIVEGLRWIALAEPTLGFNPDDVADRAARRQRDRRVAIGTGLAVTAVASAAVALAPNMTGTSPVGGSSTSATPPSSGYVSTSAGVPAAHDLDAQAARNQQHLRQVFGPVHPAAKQVKVGEFSQPYPGLAGSSAMITSEVMFRDTAGLAYFTLTVVGPEAAGTFEPLAKRCDPHPVGDDGKPIEVPRLENGRPLRCEKLRQPDGSTVVVSETGSPISEDLNVVKVVGLDAMHYRTDGSMVTIVNDNLISARLAEEYGEKNADGTAKHGFRPRPPLTEPQLIALVTDPAFNLD
jgi:hypothetical protein